MPLPITKAEIFAFILVIFSNFIFQVGDKVETKAVQQNEHGGWHAEQINVLEKAWEAEVKETTEIDLADLHKAVVVGKVTKFHNKHGAINSEIEFSLSDCSDGFVPAKGDWVSAYVEEIELEISEGKKLSHVYVQ